MKPLFTLLFGLPILFPSLASAIISDQPGAESDPRALAQFVSLSKKLAFPYWMHVGQIERSTGVYMGNGYVLTAAHVGEGAFRLPDGSIYPMEPNSARILRNRDGSQADFCLFRVQYHRTDSLARLQPIPLATVAPRLGADVLLLGAGAGGSRQSGSRSLARRSRVEHGRGPAYGRRLAILASGGQGGTLDGQGGEGAQARPRASGPGARGCPSGGQPP